MYKIVGTTPTLLLSISHDCFTRRMVFSGSLRHAWRNGTPVNCMYCSMHLVASVLPRNIVLTSTARDVRV